MRLVTYHDGSGAHLGALRDDAVVALDAVAPTPDSRTGKVAFEYRGEIVALDAVARDMLALIDGGEQLLEWARAALQRAEIVRELRDVRLLAPIPRPRQNVICLGMNYVAHAIESDRSRGREPKLPEHPVFFTKAVTAVCGPDDEIPLDPRVTTQLDYEVELAYIVGRTAKNIDRADALGYIFGYTVVNDVSAREVQTQHQQFFKGKSLDRSCPMGPCIVTADEIPDPAALGLRLRLNGETRQDSTVSDLIFDIPTTLAVLSLGQTIEAGTIVSTGTPSGVGLGRTPPEYMRAGDVMEAEVDRIGVLRNRIVAAE
jgi:2-keto-4-pentenoate hydratase/2-oxohepta-3-ene-1,7-dioic acid hydratase in catechol pathway